MISGLKATNYENKLKELGISSLDKRRKYLDMLQTYKVITGKDNVERPPGLTWPALGRVQKDRLQTR
jgi:hypothetical protein